MKKLLKVTALLLVAVAMFAGCANSSSSSDDDKGSKDAAKKATLFKESDLTEDFTYSSSTKLDDGDWVLSFIQVTNVGEVHPDYENEITETELVEFTISESGTKATFTKYTEGYIQTTICKSGNITGEAKKEAEAHGMTVSGNKASMEKTKDRTESELASMNISFVNSYLAHASKTNSEKTKFYGEESGTTPQNYNYNIKMYIMKK